LLTIEASGKQYTFIQSFFKVSWAEVRRSLPTFWKSN